MRTRWWRLLKSRTYWHRSDFAQSGLCPRDQRREFLASLVQFAAPLVQFAELALRVGDRCLELRTARFKELAQL
jgi:hypothetical protein